MELSPWIGNPLAGLSYIGIILRFDKDLGTK